MNAVNVKLFGSDPKIQKALTIATNVAVTKAPVLIVGEAGVGKRTLGQFIHQNSTRENKPFEIVECNQDDIKVEQAILGHRDEESGHFKKGVLESGNNGTIVLANIDCMSEKFQRRLHQIIGELADYDIDLRFIVTTSKNLSKLVGAGRFYRGLYTMLAGNQITIPPIRERVEDLRMFVDYYLAEYTEEGSEEIVLSDEEYGKIYSYYWTHNLKELQGVIRNMVTGGDTQALSGAATTDRTDSIPSFTSESDSDGIRLMSLKEAEKLLIQKALVHTSENRTQAAKILGVSIRTLRNKINEYRGHGSAYFVNLR